MIVQLNFLVKFGKFCGEVLLDFCSITAETALPCISVSLGGWESCSFAAPRSIEVCQRSTKLDDSRIHQTSDRAVHLSACVRRQRSKSFYQHPYHVVSSLSDKLAIRRNCWPALKPTRKQPPCKKEGEKGRLAGVP